MTGITVGFDGSHSALRALEWAMSEAALRHVPLTVLTVHPVAVSGWTGNPIILPEDAPEVQKARQAAGDAVAKTAAGLGQPGIGAVTVRGVSGVPGEELIRASAGAELLVVGARGMGGMRRMLLGSVSSAVVHHARCPVAVIRDAG
jgi:nucleotide-binding universal stress UspA family protein